jgi:cell fate (sporulation/competence/biofilm development) regulator YlbF (YheA/YmcA/DUF963 family)
MEESLKAALQNSEFMKRRKEAMKRLEQQRQAVSVFRSFAIFGKREDEKPQ